MWTVSCHPCPALATLASLRDGQCLPDLPLLLPSVAVQVHLCGGTAVAREARPGRSPARALAWSPRSAGSSSSHGPRSPAPAAPSPPRPAAPRGLSCLHSEVLSDILPLQGFSFQLPRRPLSPGRAAAPFPDTCHAHCAVCASWCAHFPGRETLPFLQGTRCARYVQVPAAPTSFLAAGGLVVSPQVRPTRLPQPSTSEHPVGTCPSRFGATCCQNEFIKKLPNY